MAWQLSTHRHRASWTERRESSFSQLKNFGGTVLSCLVCDTRPRLEPTHPGNPPTTRVFQRGHLQISADRLVTQSLYITRSLTVSFPWAFLRALEEELCFLIWSREETPQLSSPVNYSFFPPSFIVTPEPFLILALMSKFFSRFFFSIYISMCRTERPWDCKPTGGHELVYSKWLHGSMAHLRQGRWDLKKSITQPIFQST